MNQIDDEDIHGYNDSGGGCFRSVFGRSFCDPLSDVGDIDNTAGDDVTVGRIRAKERSSLASYPLSSSPKNTKTETAFDETIQLLGKELSKISLRDRLKCTEEVHGVFGGTPAPSSTKLVSSTTTTEGVAGVPISQTQQFSAIGDDAPANRREDPRHTLEQDRISQMQYHIQCHISSKQKEAYKRACLLAPQKFGPGNLDFHEMWLQACWNDPKEAALRMCDNFFYKARLFGMEKVAKTITLDDLDEHDMIVLRKGFAMWLPTRDMAGRPVFVHTLTICDHPCTTMINHVSRRDIQCSAEFWYHFFRFRCGYGCVILTPLFFYSFCSFLSRRTMCLLIYTYKLCTVESCLVYRYDRTLQLLLR